MNEEFYKDASNQCIKIIIEYLNRGLFVKNNKLFAFYILKGYDMLITIFSIMMYQTKNMDIAFYKCQKASHLYIEYIEQISDEQNIYLNLTSRDALLYVYKQTIFDELDLNKACDPLDKTGHHMIFESIYAYTGIYKKILEIYFKSMNKLVDNNKLMDNNKLLDNNNNKSIHMTIQQIKTLYEGVHIHEMDTLKVLDRILDTFYCSEVNAQTFFETFKTLLKKINQPNVLLKIKKKLYTENIPNNLFINEWINE